MRKPHPIRGLFPDHGIRFERQCDGYSVVAKFEFHDAWDTPLDDLVRMRDKLTEIITYIEHEKATTEIKPE